MKTASILQSFVHGTLPQIKPGDTVAVHQKIIEGGKERVQAFEGVVIRVVKPQSLDGSFTVRKISSGVGVEKTYPLGSSNIAKIEFKKAAKTRRARLYYLRFLAGKALRLREVALKRKDWQPGSDAEPPSAQPTEKRQTKVTSKKSSPAKE